MLGSESDSLSSKLILKAVDYTLLMFDAQPNGFIYGPKKTI